MAFINEKVKFSRLKSGAIVPKYASASAAGADLYACMGEDIVVSPGETVKVSTGLAVAMRDWYMRGADLQRRRGWRRLTK